MFQKNIAKAFVLFVFFFQTLVNDRNCELSTIQEIDLYWSA